MDEARSAILLRKVNNIPVGRWSDRQKGFYDEHAETPGLGAKADKWFQKGEKGDIIGKDPVEPLTVSKDGGQVDAITASTITSRAFLLAVNNAYNAYKATPATDAESGASKQVKE